MGLFTILKRNSKLALKGAWGCAIVIILIILGVSLLISVLEQVAIQVFVTGQEIQELSAPAGILAGGKITQELINASSITLREGMIIAVFSALSLFLLVPLILGMTRWYFAIVYGEKLPVSEVFHFYESGRAYGKAIWYDINISIRSFMWAALCYAAPCAVLFASVYYLTAKEDLARTAAAAASAGIFLSVALFLLASLFYAAAISRYTLVPYLLGESDEISVSEAVKTSVRYTKGFRFSIVWFGLSFFGWVLLSVIAIPLMLYVMPYYQTAIAIYSRYIIEKNRFAQQENATREFTAQTEVAVMPPDETPGEARTAD